MIYKIHVYKVLGKRERDGKVKLCYINKQIYNYIYCLINLKPKMIFFYSTIMIEHSVSNVLLILGDFENNEDLLD